jgi:hypothetical protein
VAEVLVTFEQRAVDPEGLDGHGSLIGHTAIG